MERSIELLAWHGWAFDRQCWNGWEELLPEHINLKCFDRGYRGDPQLVAPGSGYGRSVIFTHSFGLHLCPAKYLQEADLLVVFCGFERFHPVAPQFNRRSKMVLKQMMQNLQENPEDLLQQFMQNTYKPEPSPQIDPDEYEQDRLLEDLQELNRSALDSDALSKTGKICILHGTSDAIVPNSKGRELFGKVRRKASYLEVKGAGHALPFTHTRQCWDFIRPELNQLDYRQS